MRVEQHVSVPRCGQLAVLTACRARGARFAVAQDARRDDLGPATIRNPGNVGLNPEHDLIGAGSELGDCLRAPRTLRSPLSPVPSAHPSGVVRPRGWVRFQPATGSELYRRGRWARQSQHEGARICLSVLASTPAEP